MRYLYERVRGHDGGGFNTEMRNIYENDLWLNELKVIYHPSLVILVNHLDHERLGRDLNPTVRLSLRTKLRVNILINK